MAPIGKNFVEVEFRVKAEVPYGVTLRLSGSVSQLGYSSPSNSIPLYTSPEDYPTWKSGPVYLPMNTKISYKYLKYSGGVFESWETPKENSHILNISHKRKTIVEDTYGVYSKNDNIEISNANIKRAASSEPLRMRSAAFGSCPALSQHRTSSISVPNKKKTVLFVAYRLPVILTRLENGDWDIRWDYENMYLFSEKAMSEYSVWWCGALTYLRTSNIFSQTDEYTPNDMIQIQEKLSKMHCLPIFMDTELNHLYYNGYCKSVLSPVLHSCSMVYDDQESSFSWQKDTHATRIYQNAYRRVNNLFAQEILRYCQQEKLLDDELIIWINGYQLMLLPRDLRIYLQTYRKHNTFMSGGSNKVNLYTSGSLGVSSVQTTGLSGVSSVQASGLSSVSSVQASGLSSVSSVQASGSLNASSLQTSTNALHTSPSFHSTETPGISTPTSPSLSPVTKSFVEESEERNSMFSPGPTFVDNLEDDMDDEKMMQLYYHSGQEGKTEEAEESEEERDVNVKIIFFLHVPFPTYEMFRQLPLRTSILRGILASDLIGTHTYSSARHIISSCCRHLGITQRVQRNSNICLQWGSRSVCVYISHVGLDSGFVDSVQLKTDDVSLTEKFPGELENKTIIAGVDELTQTNGILFKIKAFHQLLREIPAFRSQVVLVQVCYQQRSVSNLYRLYENQILEAVNRCNEEFPHSIVLHTLRGSFFSIEERIALWKVARIYLNTSLSQGLNLHPQEFLLTRKQEGGIAIVSEFASSHEFLNGALAVNPWDVNSIVSQLEKAIEMSDHEVKFRQQRDIDSISKREKRLWACNVITNLLQTDMQESIQTTRQPGQELINEEFSAITYHLDLHEANVIYQKAESRFFILDYGGTLLSKEEFNRDLKDDFQGVLQRPPNASMSRVLQKLCNDPRNEVWVISSSGSMVVEKTLGAFKNMGLIAVNGLKVRRPGSTEWEPSPEYRRKPLPMGEKILALCREYLFQTNGSTMYHDNYVVRFHYQYCDPDFGKMMAEKLIEELKVLLANVSVKIVHDVGVVEVRSFLGTRGDIVNSLLNQYKERNQHDPAFVLCMGDSIVDEHMFQTVQNFFSAEVEDEEEPMVITCTVGAKPSIAQYYTLSVQENYRMFSLFTEEKK